jgi:threonyl-tRNA synthetase
VGFFVADSIELTFPDGTVASFPSGTTGLEVALSIGERLAAAAVVIKLNGEQFDLARPLEEDGSFEVVTDSSEEGRFVIRHSAAHVLAQAVLDQFPGAAYAIGPPIDDGFYYDFDVGRAFTPDDLEALDARVQEIIAEDQPFERQEISRDEGVVLFADQPYKTEIITDGEASQGVGESIVSLYRNNDFVDLRTTPNCNASTAPHGRTKRSSRLIWRAWRRPGSATTASWVSSSTFSHFRRSSAPVSLFGIPKGDWSARLSRTTAATHISRTVTKLSPRLT